MIWVGITLGAGLLCSLGWLFVAHDKAKVAATARDFRSARPAWLVGLLVFALATLGATLYVLKSLGLEAIFAPEPIITTLLMCFGLGRGWFMNGRKNPSKS